MFVKIRYFIKHLNSITMQTKYSAIVVIFQVCQNKDERSPRSVVTNVLQS